MTILRTSEEKELNVDRINHINNAQDFFQKSFWKIADVKFRLIDSFEPSLTVIVRPGFKANTLEVIRSEILGQGSFLLQTYTQEQQLTIRISFDKLPSFKGSFKKSTSEINKRLLELLSKNPEATPVVVSTPSNESKSITENQKISNSISNSNITNPTMAKPKPQDLLLAEVQSIMKNSPFNSKNYVNIVINGKGGVTINCKVDADAKSILDYLVGKILIEGFFTEVSKKEKSKTVIIKISKVPFETGGEVATARNPRKAAPKKAAPKKAAPKKANPKKSDKKKAEVSDATPPTEKKVKAKKEVKVISLSKIIQDANDICDQHNNVGTAIGVLLEDFEAYKKNVVQDIIEMFPLLQGKGSELVRIKPSGKTQILEPLTLKDFTKIVKEKFE